MSATDQREHFDAISDGLTDAAVTFAVAKEAIDAFRDAEVSAALDQCAGALELATAWLARSREIAGPMYAAGYKEQP